MIQELWSGIPQDNTAISAEISIDIASVYVYLIQQEGGLERGGTVCDAGDMEFQIKKQINE